jgi:hypothetical protein
MFIFIIMKNTRFAFIIILSLFVLGCHTSSRPPMQNIFTFNFQEGKAYEYEMEWDIDQVIMGRTSKLNMSSLYSLNVEEANSFEKRLTGMYRSFKMNVKGLGIEWDIDTEKPMVLTDTMDAVSLIKRFFYATIGQPFEMIINNSGELVAVKGFEKILDNIADSIRMDDKTRAMAIASFKDQFNNEAVKDQFVQLFAIFPNKTIKAGDTWEKSYDFVGKLPAKFATTYTVKEIEDDLVTLDLKSRIDSDSTFGITGEQTGTMVADSRWGLVLSADFKQNIAIKTGEFVMEINATGTIRGKAVDSK